MSFEGNVPAVVGNKYISVNPFVLNTVKKGWGYSWKGDFYVEDQNHNCLFTGHKSGGFGKKIELREPNGVPVVFLRKKALNFRKWHIYSGSEERDDALLFEFKKKTSKSEIYLASNVVRQQADFTVQASSMFSRDFKVYHNNQIIGEATREGFKFGKRKIFMSGVPLVDLAFVAAILVIMEEEYEDLDKSSGDGG